MTCGEKIAFLRRAKGMTQSDLGAQLNVTFQAVSKWERGESYPDFETLSKIAKIFEKPISYFENEPSELVDESNVALNAEPVAAVAKPEAAKVMLGVCKECGKVVYEGDQGITQPALVCKGCVDRQIEQQNIEKKKQKEKEKATRESIIRRRNRGLIWSSVITSVLLVAYIVLMCWLQMYDSLAFLPVVLIWGYTFFAQLFWDGVIVDVCLWEGRVIGTPGVIFTLDLDGIFFLICVRILFAILRFLAYIATIVLSIGAAMVISPFAFVPQLVKISKGNEL